MWQICLNPCTSTMANFIFTFVVVVLVLECTAIQNNESLVKQLMENIRNARAELNDFETQLAACKVKLQIP